MEPLDSGLASSGQLPFIVDNFLDKLLEETVQDRAKEIVIITEQKIDIYLYITR